MNRNRILTERVSAYLALLLVSGTVALMVRNASYVAVMTDPAGYVGAAQRWLEHDLFRPVHFQLLPGWPNYLDSGTPPGFRPSPIAGTDVGEYPLGFPVFTAAAMVILGRFGAYLAAPLFTALLALCAYRLGVRLAGTWCGAIASVAIVINPVTVRHAIHPMSDIPATALWMLAWLMALRTGIGAAAAAGSAVAAAVMVRPNLAPLAVVVAVFLFFRRERDCWSLRRSVRSVGVFGVFAAIGCILVLWSQHAQYGDALTVGYRGAADFFRWDHIRQNLILYPQWLSEVHTPIIFAGFAAVPWGIVRRDTSPDGNNTRAILFSGMAMILVNFALYLPYLNFQQWTYLRFLLPAITVLTLFCSAGTVWLATWLGSHARMLVPIALLPTAVMIGNSLPLVRDAFASGPHEMRVLLMVRYLREALPQNAVLFTGLHGGSLMHYTGRAIVLFQSVPPPLLDAEVARLQLRRQKPFFVIDDVLESRGMREYFAPSQFHTLDWAPRAEFASPTAIWLMDPADRIPYRTGSRWPMDILHWPD